MRFDGASILVTGASPTLYSACVEFLTVTVSAVARLWLAATTRATFAAGTLGSW